MLTRKHTQILLACVLIVIVFIVAVIVTHNTFTVPYPGHNDFMSRWEGARSFWIDGLNPYGEPASLNIQQRIYGRRALETEDPGYFAYPFYTVFLVWPLVYMDYAWASAIWMVVLAAALIASTFLLFDLFRWKPGPLLLGFLMLWSLIFYFSARGLILGQPAVVVYLLEVLAIWALVKKRDRMAGVALAISTFKPQMGFLIVPFLLLWGLRDRRWKFVTAFSVTLVLLLVASFILLPSWLGDWLAQLRLYTSYTAIGSPDWVITTYYLRLGDWAELLVGLILVAGMLVAWYRVLRGKRERFLWAAALTLTITHLVATRTATTHFIVFIIPLVFYLAYISRHCRRRSGLWITLILMALLVIPWMHFLTTVEGEFEHPTLYLPLPFLSLAVLWWTRHLWFAYFPQIELRQ
jgi:hypothetical protein